MPDSCYSSEELAGAEEGLSLIIGQPLTDMFRYLGFQKFEFGEQIPYLNKKSKVIFHSDLGLVVGAWWQISGPCGFVLNSDHFPSGGPRTDDHAMSFYKSLHEPDSPVVTAITVDHTGGLEITMTHGYSLRVLGDYESTEWQEAWRFMPKEEDLRGHLVLDNFGLQWSGHQDPSPPAPDSFS